MVMPQNTTDYYRTPGPVLEDIGKVTKYIQPINVYNKLLVENSVCNAPKDLHQIRNKKYHDKNERIKDQR